MTSEDTLLRSHDYICWSASLRMIPAVIEQLLAWSEWHWRVFPVYFWYCCREVWSTIAASEIVGIVGVLPTVPLPSVSLKSLARSSFPVELSHQGERQSAGVIWHTHSSATKNTVRTLRWIMLGAIFHRSATSWLWLSESHVTLWMKRHPNFLSAFVAHEPLCSPA